MSTADLYDDDDLVDQYDGYGDDNEELSPEDKTALVKGTIEVKKVLGADASKVSIVQIQEALWHYYYDIDKSVGYLRKKFISPTVKPPTKKVPQGKAREFFFSDMHGVFARVSGASQGCTARSAQPRYGPQSQPTALFNGNVSETSYPPSTAAEAFADMPWLDVPQDRLAILRPPPTPPGGLLGGGEGPAKMSKLQALAAARKKETDQKKEQENASSLADNGMKRLSLSEHARKDGEIRSASPAKRFKYSDPQDHLPLPDSSTDNSFFPRRGSKNNTQPTREANMHRLHDAKLGGEALSQPAFHSSSAVDEHTPAPNLEAAPSACARTLLGSAPHPRQADRPGFFAMPYTMSPVFHAAAFSKPSPDDIVLAAQAKAGKKTASPPKPAAAKAPIGEDKKQSELANGVLALKVSDAPPPKSKGLDVIKEFEKGQAKKSTSFVVVGHVDAGKSTLMGRLLLELKYIEKRTVDKYRRQAEKAGKQSFALAWVMDQGSEERDRGVTIDIATNHFETPSTRFTILDAPGHRDFVPNMIAGASQADLAILVIDANTGAFEKGLKDQTREHVLLLRSLGVQRLIVAVNKLDMVGWSKDRFDEIREQVGGFLSGLGFQKKHLSFVPISGLNGDNIASKTENTAASWYSGPTLIDALEDPGPPIKRALEKSFRMPISEIFRSQQGTTTLAGRIDSGTVQVGDSVVVQPSGESAYIKSIMVDTDAQEWAVAGQSVSFALTSMDASRIRVGDIVCDAANPLQSGDTFTMKAMAFDHVMPMPVDLHRGRLHAAGQILSISAVLDKTTGEVVKKKPKLVQPGAVARIQVRLSSKVALEAGQRVVIRSGGETVAAGLLE